MAWHNVFANQRLHRPQAQGTRCRILLLQLPLTKNTKMTTSHQRRIINILISRIIQFLFFNASLTQETGGRSRKKSTKNIGNGGKRDQQRTKSPKQIAQSPSFKTYSSPFFRQQQHEENLNNTEKLWEERCQSLEKGGKIPSLLRDSFWKLLETFRFPNRPSHPDEC
jgi:hypothetical protein